MGVHVSQEIWRRDGYKLVALAYTNCLAVCPMVADRLKSLETQLRKQNGKRLPPQVYLLSINPDEDTDQARAQFLVEKGHREWLFLRGPIEQVRQFAGILEMGFGDPNAIKSSHMLHTTRVALLNSNGRYLKSWDLLKQSATILASEIAELISKP
jgi:cytochrome oxidase Cu insertion factor (SCO1/SenC/PrrC family)